MKGKTCQRTLFWTSTNLLSISLVWDWVALTSSCTVSRPVSFSCCERVVTSLRIQRLWGSRCSITLFRARIPWTHSWPPRPRRLLI